jgi:GNAT superfamily N-acetyltransferase
VSGCVRVAVDDEGVPLGFATVVPGSERVGELDGLFVEPEHMRRGIGRMLIDDAVTIARRRGDARIEVTANPAALEFYAALGFVIDGEAPTRFGPATRMHLDL